jgi:hypothetical protein
LYKTFDTALDDEDNADRKDEMLFDEEFNNDFLYMPQQYNNLAANSGLQDLLQNNNQQSTYECPLCGKEVVSKYNLKRHMMIHTGKFHFENLHLLPFLISSLFFLNSGEKPYNCEICNKGFRECSDLRKHKKVHVNGSKLFECTICLRSFSTYKANKVGWFLEKKVKKLVLKYFIYSATFAKKKMTFPSRLTPIYKLKVMN